MPKLADKQNFREKKIFCFKKLRSSQKIFCVSREIRLPIFQEDKMVDFSRENKISLLNISNLESSIIVKHD